ncbi:cell division control protein 14, SIN component-domain-containing protein [Amanita rubescens]|nr:cell division control protein 14, SIN component-domain-containing protein [Amanita rubescens]
MVDHSEMQSCIQDALDELLSPRSQADAKTRALEVLERQLALACLNDSESLNQFKSLQQWFECNISCRLLMWISITTPKLDALISKGIVEKGRENDVSKMVSQLTLALSIIQGAALIHHGSKVYLGRKHALEILLDLLLISRHVSASSQPHLSSIVLDTLLCILVDAPNSLRSLENVNGVQLVVKILKRAGTPREVRMKCLEFLYFYLLDETPAPIPTSSVQVHAEVPTTPVTPARKKHYFASKPMFPSSSRQASSASLTTSRSASDESIGSMTSASTAPSSVASSPDNTSMLSVDVSVTSSSPATSPSSYNYRVPIGSPPLVPLCGRPKSGHGNFLSPNPLRRRQIGSSLRHVPSKSLSAIPSSKTSPPASRTGNKLGLNKSWSEELHGREDSLRGLARLALGVGTERVKSTDEKKELLGTMLGNVDALVESVRKAGIWGLG